MMDSTSFKKAKRWRRKTRQLCKELKSYKKQKAHRARQSAKAELRRDPEEMEITTYEDRQNAGWDII